MEISDTDIAIVGMSCRFPGATTPDEFWRNLRDGVESVERLSEDELREAGVAEELLANRQYVKSCAPLAHMPDFDSEFFGLSPREAAIMDPQHRHFLECAWEALESAAHPPSRFAGSIGVYAGCGMNAYMMFNLLTNPELMNSVGLFLVRHTGNDKDFLATRVSFNLNLRGPSISVQTACSTSLVAIHMASQSLISGECDMALAGGVTIEQPHRRGYLYVDGEILSPDGHCRPFDHRSQGTIFGSGVGVVVLRRLEDAIDDGDQVLAVIKGSAINNDGSNKAGYLAPSVEGQAGAIAEALEVSGFSAEKISYVEAHGTGTPIGDPIEIAALSEAYRATTEKQGFCRIGSVKSNIGHLDTAAGVASVIKVVQALRHHAMPPSLNFEAPNPACDFEGSPFVVNDSLRDWPRGDEPRRAGVSSLGVGGTNAHLILQEAPPRAESSPSRALQLLTLSARNPDALQAACEGLAAHLRESDVALADVAYTLEVGREEFASRRTLVCRDRDDAIALLEGSDAQRIRNRRTESGKQTTTFLFPGGGAQYPRMGLDLYENEPAYREHIDRGLALLLQRHQVDIRALLFPEPDALEAAAAELTRPSLQLPALFIVEYALAQLWMSWGIQPDSLIGHSMGENTAACVAGILSFEDALGLVTLRGQLFERVPRGGMLSVALAAEELEPLLGDELDLAAINAPSLCVATGPEDALVRLEATLAEREVETQRIKIDIAAHSRMLEPILSEFGDYLRGVELSPPTIPIISNRSGSWLSDEDATDPDYWVRHLRGTVLFAEGIGLALQQPGAVLLEAGPGKTLSSLTRQSSHAEPGQAILSSLRHPKQEVSDWEFLLDVLGQLWAAGVPIDWEKFYQAESRLRVSLPTYAFQRQRYWIEPGEAHYASAKDELRIEKIEALSDWFFEPRWIQQDSSPDDAPALDAPSTWLVFLDTLGVGARLSARLRESGHTVLTVREGDAYYRVGEHEFALAPEEGRSGYDALLGDLAERELLPSRIVHLWTLTPDRGARPGSSFYHHVQERGFFSLTLLAQALGDQNLESGLHISVITNGSQSVGDVPLLYPEKATLAGPCKVIPQEFPGVTCSRVDVELPAPAGLFGRKRTAEKLDGLALLLHDEVRREASNQSIALTGGARCVQEFVHTDLSARDAGSVLRQGGTYMITGGLGGIGLVLAEHLARTRQAKLVLVGRTPIPERSHWEAWLADEGPRDRVSQKLAKLLELERLGAEVFAAAADVANLEQMQRIVDDAVERFGPIDGVFHAAGTLNDDLIQVKNQTDIEEVFAPKIQGAMVLEEVLREREVGFVVLFSSTSSVLGAAGQVDYVAANAFLNAFAHARNQTAGPHWLAVNWGVWADVGMGAEAAQRRHAGEAAPGAEASGEAAVHPMLGRLVTNSKTETVFETEYAPVTEWVLDQHRTLAGKALIPGTGYVELARASFVESGQKGPVELRDLFFLEPLQVDDGEVDRVRISLRGSGESKAFEVSSSRLTAFGAESSWRQNAVGEVATGSFTTPDALDLEAIRTRCGSGHTAHDPNGIRTRQETEHLAFGARWRCLNEIWWGDGEALAALSLPEAFHDELASFALHPALLDLATGFGLDLIEGYAESDKLFVPFSYQRVRIHAALTPRIYSHIRSSGENRADKELITFDVTLCDELGRVLVEISSFTVKRVDEAIAFEGSPPAAPSRAAVDVDSSVSPAERAFLRTLEAGILRDEGIEALERLLAAEPRSQIIVSSIELQTLIDQVVAATPVENPGGTRFERPNLATEYVAARNSVEESIVALWEDMLGVDQVGIQDDFFELGGHSLIAVRLFVKIKKELQVDYPISVLYEAPTIEKFAELVSEEIGDGSQETRASKRPSHRFLVPMHSDAPDGRTPFYLVAGMFGNVLNLRHLADLIGKDRPFYAIQARGLYGDDKPHENFAEMASDYLEELRAVQPHGPYMIGGFSGGGIAAFEMAQQLVASGERVSSLVFLDSPTADSPDSLSSRDKLLIHLQRLREQGAGYLGEWLEARVRWEIEKRQKRDEEASQSFEFRSAEIEAAFYRALEVYRTQPYAGSVTLFRPPLPITNRLGGGRVVNEDREFVYEDNAWSRYLTGQFEVTEVPGDHDSMVLEPNVRVLAAELKKRLAQASEEDA